MQRIVITIEDGQLTGVYTDGEPVMVDLIDYDNINAGHDGEEEANEVEQEIANGTLKSCW